jgi:hypothetical protein
MEKINILEQLNYSIGFILHREKKIIEHRNNLKNYIGKPFYKTLEEGIKSITNEVMIENKILIDTFEKYNKTE